MRDAEPPPLFWYLLGLFLGGAIVYGWLRDEREAHEDTRRFLEAHYSERERELRAGRDPDEPHTHVRVPLAKLRAVLATIDPDFAAAAAVVP